MDLEITGTALKGKLGVGGFLGEVRGLILVEGQVQQRGLVQVFNVAA